MKEEAITPRQKQAVALTPRQKQLALAKKRRQNWRRQVQNRVNKNEIPNRHHRNCRDPGLCVR